MLMDEFCDASLHYVNIVTRDLIWTLCIENHSDGNLQARSKHSLWTFLYPFLSHILPHVVRPFVPIFDSPLILKHGTSSHLTRSLRLKVLQSPGSPF